MRARAVIPSPTTGTSLRKKSLEPYKLTLRAVQGLQVPDSLAREIEGSRPDDLGAPQLYHRLSASLFDTEERRFFGRTWEGGELQVRDPLARSTDIEHDADLYFHSPLNGSRCVIVIEHVLVVRRNGGGPTPAQEHGCGWCVLRPFEGRLRDSSEQAGRGSSRDDQPPMDFYQGSPLALLQLPAPFDRSPYLNRGSAALVYSLKTHRALRPAMHLLSPDVFYSTTPPIPGLLPGREPGRDGRLLAAPLSKPDQKSVQTSCRVTASSLRITIPAYVEQELAKAAFTAQQPPPPRGGRAPPAPAKVTTGQRRLLIALHSSYAILADKSAQNAPPPAPPSLDGRQITPPPGSIIAPKSLNLEEVKGDRNAPRDSLVLRPTSNSTAQLDGFVNSTSVAVVFELQVEVTLPPPAGKQYERRTKWVPLMWGCTVPAVQHGSYPRLPQFPIRGRADLKFGSMGKPCPLSFEKVPVVSGTGLKSMPFIPYLEVEVNPSPGTNTTMMEKELDSADADEAAR